MASGVKTSVSTIGIKKLRAQIGRRSRLLTIGVHEEATADVDDGNTKRSVKVAPYAAANEFGTERIPARPFLKNTMKKYSKDWERLLVAQLKNRGNDLQTALNAVGNAATGDVKATITEGNFTPLKPQTIKNKERKGRPKPSAILIDTGSLIKSIAYKVK